MSLEDTLISVWRQVLVENKPSVVVNRHRYRVGFTRSKRLRTVEFSHGRYAFFGIEQNPDTRSRWAALARSGKKIMQFSYAGRYVANVCEGKLLRYPAWRTLKLPARGPERNA